MTHTKYFLEEIIITSLYYFKLNLLLHQLIQSISEKSGGLCEEIYPLLTSPPDIALCCIHSERVD